MQSWLKARTVFVGPNPVRTLLGIAGRRLSAPARKASALVKRVAVRESGRVAAIEQAIRDLSRRIQAHKKKRRLARQPLRLWDIEKSGKPVVLFLSPEAGLEPFHASQVMLAKTLDKAGHSAVVLSCNGLLPICTFKFASGTGQTAWNETENPTCVACRASRQKAADDYELLEISLESVLNAGDQTLIDDVVKRFEANPWTAQYDDVAFGTICLAEVLRDRRKHAVEELDERDVGLLIGLLRASLAIYLVLKTLSSRFNLHQLAYFGEYAYWQSAQILAARNGIGLLALSHGYHRDVDRRLLSIRPRHAMAHIFEQIDDWQNYTGHPVPPKIISEIADGALYRLTNQGGASTYSPTWSNDSRKVFRELGLSRWRQTIVAYPSSYDEYVCIAGQLTALGFTYPDRPQPFADQDAWMRELVQWVSNRPDLQLVLRMHPRMGVGHRHSTISSDYRKMKDEFAAVPSNVVVVWPESKISSYSLAELADVALISWSSMGLELARFGVPVVAAFQRIGPVPLSDFIKFEVETDRYFVAVEAALDETATIEKISGAFRWTHYLHWASLIDVSDIVPTPDFPGVPIYRWPREQATMLDVLVNRADVTQLNMSKLDVSDAARMSERAAVVDAIEKFVAFFDSVALAGLKGKSEAVSFGTDAALQPPTRLVKRLIDLLQDEMRPTSSGFAERVGEPEIRGPVIAQG